MGENGDRCGRSLKFGVVLPLASDANVSQVLELGIAAGARLRVAVAAGRPDDGRPGRGGMLAMLAARTRRVRLGFSILLLPQRETAATARAIATIDAASGGRVILGVGVGTPGARRSFTTGPPQSAGG